MEVEKQKTKTKIEYPFQNGDNYWYVTTIGVTVNDTWTNHFVDREYYKQGNVFLTEKEAQREIERRLLLTRFRQFRDKCNGDWKPEWRKEYDNSYCYNIELTYDDGKASFETDWNRSFNPFCLFGYFKNERDCNRAIELFGDEIIRLWVEEAK